MKETITRTIEEEEYKICPYCKEAVILKRVIILTDGDLIHKLGSTMADANRTHHSYTQCRRERYRVAVAYHIDPALEICATCDHFISYDGETDSDQCLEMSERYNEERVHPAGSCGKWERSTQSYTFDGQKKYLLKDKELWWVKEE